MKDVCFDIALLGEMKSTHFHQEDIIVHHKGWNKFYPHLGVGISNFIDDEDNFELKRDIQKEYKRDGLKNIKVEIDFNSKFYANANY